MRSRFEEQLDILNLSLIEMGALAETAISMAIDALKKQDTDLAHKAIAYDAEVDQKEKDIEQLCVRLLLQQQPVARDLRLITAALKMITDMERIGDQAADISNLSIKLSEKPHIKELEHITMMATAARKMVTESIDAFVHKDPALAEKVARDDDVVDDLFITVRNDLVDMIRKDEKVGDRAIDLIMVAKYLERIGDHAVNIAEWAAYAITGIHIGDG